MKKFKKLLPYIITGVIGLGVSAWYFFTTYPSETMGIFQILCNAFFIPGALLLCIGGLVWIASTDFFDGLSFALTYALHAFLPFLSSQTKPKKFYDYKVEREAARQGKDPVQPFFLLIGLGLFVLSLVFLFLFFKYENV